MLFLSTARCSLRRIKFPGGFVRTYIRFLAFVLIVSGCFSCISRETNPSDYEWQIRRGFEKSFLTDSVEGWENITLPANLNEIEKYHTERGWVTLRKDINQEIRAMPPGAPLAVNIDGVSDVSAYYINGVLLHESGRAEPYLSAHDSQFIQVIPEHLIKSDGANYLVLAVYTPGTHLIVKGPIEIGSAETVFHNYVIAVIIAFALISLYAAIGLYHVLLAIRRPKDLYNLYFGIFCLLFAVFFSANTEARDLIYGTHSMVATKMDQLSLYSICPFMAFFISLFFSGKYSRVGIVYAISSVIMVLIGLFGGYSEMEKCLLVWELTVPFLLLYLFYEIGLQAWRGNVDARILIGGFFLLMLGVAQDILVEKHIIPGFFGVTNYAFLLFIAGIAAVLANRFVRVHNEVEELNTSLENKVQDRTAKLQKTLDAVRELKMQQDGDYFLTSLLLKPLGGNFVSGSPVNVDILISQKKKFHFGKWDAELGGDFCAAHRIVLRGRSYVVFLNGDAMGKSMQGAGGALVLGTAFKATIARTQTVTRVRERYPETWLKECFLELQNVFVSFDGSMLVSLVLGLIDEESGLLYYLNAEHPWSVLYRGGKAVFTEDELWLRKVGIAGLENNFRLTTFKFQSDDVLIVGSDGRDDLEMGGGNGQRIINEDESRFLRIVEEGKGDLKAIYSAIQNVGEIIDDLSLMRIAFREDAAVRMVDASLHSHKLNEVRDALSSGDTPAAIRHLKEAYQKKYSIERTARALYRLYVRTKDYSAAASFCDSHSEKHPEDLDFLYYAACALKRNREFDRAADYGERCRIRKPDHLKNLINLSDIYRLTANKERAVMILNEAAEIQPANENIVSLREILMRN